MVHFCTLFDANYMTRGLALYHSLESVCPSFHLYVVAFDDNCFQYLSNAGLPHLTPVSLTDFEDEALLLVKKSRSAAEYCWTCTPSVILYCLQKYNLPSCTYLDADMIFYDNPEKLLLESHAASVIISEHRYTSDYDVSSTHGIYCVQFMTFKNNSQGLTALTWWRDRCLEWCYARLEDGKFGDQKYLDDWLERFEGVHVMKHEGGGLAPWNIQQYEIINTRQPLQVKNKHTGKISPVIFFHFHGLKFYTNSVVTYCGAIYELSKNVKETLYEPYVRRLLQFENGLRSKGIAYNVTGARTMAPPKWKVFLEYLKGRLTLAKLGNIPVISLKLFNFAAHYHYYKLTRFK